MKKLLTITSLIFIVTFVFPVNLFAQDLTLTNDGKVPGKPFEVLQQQIDALQPVPREYEVDCANGDKISDVLSEVAYTNGPVTITISGVCQESVTITRDDVTLRGGAYNELRPDPLEWFIINLNGARRVKIENLTLSGGSTGLNAESGATFEATDLNVKEASNSGVHLSSEASGILSNPTIEGCGRGVVTWGSGTLQVNGGEVKNSDSFNVQAAGSSFISLGDGIEVTGSEHQAVMAGGGQIEIQDAIIQDNHNVGVWAMSGGSIGIVGNNTIINKNHGGVMAWAGSVDLRGVEVIDNYGNGIMCTNGGQVFLEEVSVEKNLGNGISIGGNSSAIVSGSFIGDNDIHGIYVDDSSVAVFQGGANTIRYNEQWGIFCNEESPSAAQITGNPGNVADNTDGQISCTGY